MTSKREREDLLSFSNMTYKSQSFHWSTGLFIALNERMVWSNVLTKRLISNSEASVMVV